MGGARPRDAATVLLLRDLEGSAAPGVSVWMMRRRDSLPFAPDAWVFPGGAVEGSDSLPLPWVGRPMQQLAEAMACSVDRAAALVSAAIRETFEECGVLVALGGSGALDDADRQTLVDGRSSLSRMLQHTGSVVDGAALLPWAWWLTPEGSPRRYDTWFFAARAASFDEPRHIDDGEATESSWIVPSEMLERFRTGEALLLPPTVEALERLQSAGSVDEVLRHAPEVLVRRSG